MGREEWLKCWDYLNQSVAIFLLGLSGKIEIQPYMNQNLISTLENLEYSLQKSYKSINSNTIEYILRLKDEHKILNLSKDILKYYSVSNQPAFEARVAHIFLTHLFYKHQSLMQ